MEQFYAILALLFSFLSLFGFVFAFIVFLKFNAVKGWFNKRAGTEIVSSFGFRTLRTLIVTLVLGYVMVLIYIFTYAFLGSDMTEGLATTLFIILLALALAYPVWRIVQRFQQYGTSVDKKASLWLIVYDVVMNITALFGGFILIAVLAFAAVILSFTKWDNFVPGRLRELSGVDVVPASKNYYVVGAALGLIAVVSQWIGDGGQVFVGWLVGISALAIIAYAWYQIHSTPKEGRKQISWQWGYMILTTYAVFTITWILIFIALALLVIYIILMFMGHTGSGNDKYKVTCDNLTADVINGTGICSITNSRCKARDSGTCPYR